jgi:SPP1 family predicted phage head-tail adaptor
MSGAGDLNTPLTFRRPTYSFSTTNEKQAAYDDAFTVWGEKISESAALFVAAQKRHAEVSVVYRIRYRGGIAPDMQFVAGRRTYEIVQPIVDEKDRHQWLLVAGKDVV